MKARDNDTEKQLMRRLRRAPETERDLRYRNDPYWVLRLQGYPHSYAKRVLRDQVPVVHERRISAYPDDFDPADMLFSPGSTFTEVKVTLRPLLTDDAIRALEPRNSEYTVWDEKLRGFGVRVRRSGHKSFVVYCRDRSNGKLHKKTIGKIADFLLDHARQKAVDFQMFIINDSDREGK